MSRKHHCLLFQILGSSLSKWWLSNEIHMFSTAVSCHVIHQTTLFVSYYSVLATNSEVLLQTGKEEVCLRVKLNSDVLISLKSLIYLQCFRFEIVFPHFCFVQMLKLCSELEMVVSCYEAKRDKLRESKELYVTSKLLSRLIRTSLRAYKWLSEVKWLSFVCCCNYYYIFFKWTEVVGREAAGADGCEWPRWTTENWKGETFRAQVSEANYISDFCLLCHISSVLLVKEGSVAATIQTCLLSWMHLKENRLKEELCTGW